MEIGVRYLAKNNARLYDPSLLVQAGIDPKTGLPIKMGSCRKESCKTDIKKILRIIDEQNAVRRFNWINLPDGLSTELVERILYYKGQGMFFYMPSDEKFYFLPYALDGTIDVYGRYTGVTPLPFNGSTSTESKDGKMKPWITGLTREPMYDIKLDRLTVEDWENKCVLLHDYSNQISQTNISRQVLNDPLIDVMSDCIPFMRTALIKATGIAGIRVNDTDQQASVTEASRAVNDSALSGDIWIPIVGDLDFQAISEGNVAKAEEYMLAMQSLDNLRLSTYGLENGGLFEKKAHITNAELGTNNSPVSMVYQDSLKLRQDFCIIVNSIWGLNIWCEPSESVLGIDNNMDGYTYDTGNAPVDDNIYSDGGTENDGSI